CNDNTDCIIFFWDYTSRNRSIEAYKYILEISLNNDFFDIIYTSGEISTNKHSHVYENTHKDLEYEKDYYWRIKAGDEYGTWSDWAVDENKFNF
ncbi:hypothetical protein K8R32_00235, partial [bacterium]|nr:hypothetical protein [bacterium]